MANSSLGPRVDGGQGTWLSDPRSLRPNGNTNANALPGDRRLPGHDHPSVRPTQLQQRGRQGFQTRGLSGQGTSHSRSRQTLTKSMFLFLTSAEGPSDLHSISPTPMAPPSSATSAARILQNNAPAGDTNIFTSPPTSPNGTPPAMTNATTTSPRRKFASRSREELLSTQLTKTAPPTCLLGCHWYRP